VRAKRERPGRQEGASTVEGTRWLAGWPVSRQCMYISPRSLVSFSFSLPYFLISFQAISYIKCNRPCKRRRSLKRQRKEIGRKKGKKMDDSPGDMSRENGRRAYIYAIQLQHCNSVGSCVCCVCAFGAIVFSPQPYTYSTQDDCTRYAQRDTSIAIRVPRHSQTGAGMESGSNGGVSRSVGDDASIRHWYTLVMSSLG
jgi:hypothetical protein